MSGQTEGLTPGDVEWLASMFEKECSPGYQIETRRRILATLLAASRRAPPDTPRTVKGVAEEICAELERDKIVGDAAQEKHHQAWNAGIDAAKARTRMWAEFYRPAAPPDTTAPACKPTCRECELWRQIQESERQTLARHAAAALSVAAEPKEGARLTEIGLLLADAGLDGEDEVEGVRALIVKLGSQYDLGWDNALEQHRRSVAADAPPTREPEAT